MAGVRLQCRGGGDEEGRGQGEPRGQASHWDPAAACERRGTSPSLQRTAAGTVTCVAGPAHGRMQSEPMVSLFIWLFAAFNKHSILIKK